MRLDFFIVADDVRVETGNKLIVIGACITRVTATSFPASVPLVTLLARFLPDPGDGGKSYRVVHRLLDPAGETVGRVAEHDVVPSLLGEPGEETTIAVITAIQATQIAAPGMYEFQVLLDGEVLDSHPILFVRAEGSEDATSSQPAHTRPA